MDEPDIAQAAPVLIDLQDGILGTPKRFNADKTNPVTIDELGAIEGRRATLFGRGGADIPPVGAAAP